MSNVGGPVKAVLKNPGMVMLDGRFHAAARVEKMQMVGAVAENKLIQQRGRLRGR